MNERSRPHKYDLLEELICGVRATRYRVLDYKGRNQAEVATALEAIETILKSLRPTPKKGRAKK